jgi:pSer/pThr/pTyr-binding forkhead associated (FHA) protein
VDAWSHYRRLVQLGRDEFLAAAAPATLVRYRSGFDDAPQSGVLTLSIDQEIEETLPAGRDSPVLETQLEIYPLTKKPGASFPDRITIGRTSNNIVFPDSSVSRFHAHVRRDGKEWVVADAGSKNGTWLNGQPLAPRKERALASRATVRLGDVDLMFYVAADLFTALGGT